MFDLADLVRYLPDGVALWRSIGGWSSLTPVERELRNTTYLLRVLAWQGGGGKTRRPLPEPEPPYAGQERTDLTHMEIQAEARRKRLERKTTKSKEVSDGR